MERSKVFLRPPAPVRPEEPTERVGSTSEASTAVENAEITKLPVEAPPSPEELARKAAEEIVDEATRLAEDIKRSAQEQGYTDGLKEGVEQGRAQGRGEAQEELRGTLERWITMGDTLAEAWRARFAGLEEEVRDVAIAAAERLTEKELTQSPDAVLGVVRDALRHAAEAESVTLLVCPKDVALVRGAREDLVSLLKGTGRFEIQEDPKVQPGGCLVVTKTQLIDATRKTRSEIIRDSMRGGGNERAD